MSVFRDHFITKLKGVYVLVQRVGFEPTNPYGIGS
jgi:hypothetical protein